MRAYFIIVFLFFNCAVFAVPITRVYTQKQFDDVVKRINNGEEMHIKLAARTFVIKGLIRATAPLAIKGKNATVAFYNTFYKPEEAIRKTETHLIYSLKEALTFYPLFYDSEWRLLPVSESVLKVEKVNFVDGDIVGKDTFSQGTDFKIQLPPNLSQLKGKAFTNVFGYLDCGWDVAKFCVSRADKDYLYCKVILNSTINNLRYDQLVYHKPIRYVIYNAELKDNAIYYDKDYLYVPRDIGVVYCVNRMNLSEQEPTISSFSDVKLEGLNFVGIDGLVVKSKKTNSCDLYNCKFQNTLGRALTIEKNSGANVKTANIHRCVFLNCSVLLDQAVFLSGSSDGGNCFNMEGCEVSKYPSGNVFYKNPRASVYVIGNATLTENVVYNSIRDHLFLKHGRILARGNFLYNTDVFNSNVFRNLSSDFGLVYCAYLFKDTQEALNNNRHKILLEYNLLYGAYAYGGDARGIFIDDGRGDVTCKNNIILNSQLYSIDSRNVKMTEASSVRNRYEENIMSSRYRLVAGQAVKGDNIPSTKGNILYSSDSNVTSELKLIEKDIKMAESVDCYEREGRVMVPQALYELLHGTQAWKFVKHYIKKM